MFSQRDRFQLLIQQCSMYNQYVVTSKSPDFQERKQGLYVHGKAPVCLNSGWMPVLTMHTLTMKPKPNTCQKVGDYSLTTLLHILEAPLFKFVSVSMAVPLQLHPAVIPPTNTLYSTAMCTVPSGSM